MSVKTVFHSSVTAKPSPNATFRTTDISIKHERNNCDIQLTIKDHPISGAKKESRNYYLNTTDFLGVINELLKFTTDEHGGKSMKDLIDVLVKYVDRRAFSALSKN